jgi:tetratricopeptide (TPR) repeat protein
VLIGVLVSIGALSVNWLGLRLFSNQAGSAPTSTRLAAAAGEAFDRGDLDEAVELARQALTADPSSTAALVLLTRALVYRSYVDFNHERDREAAVQIAEDALLSDPNNPDRLAAYAFALQANRQSVQAAQAATQALQQDAGHILARAALSLAYGAVGSFEIARRESTQALQQSNRSLEARRALAISYSDLGNYRQAVETIKEAIQQYPRLIPLYFEQALFAMQLGDSDTATASWFQVIAFDPDNVKAHLRLCELSSTMRERRAAVDYCTTVTRLDPTFAGGWYQLGFEQFLSGNYEAAQSAFNRCATLQVMQGVPVPERKFECWYLQGQAAEIRRDCPALIATYNEFRAMVAEVPIAQSWVYPPEGPPMCQIVTATP